MLNIKFVIFVSHKRWTNIENIENKAVFRKNAKKGKKKMWKKNVFQKFQKMILTQQ